MDKSDRKFDILYSIVKDYIKTAEPVGSRTIEKKYNIGISSATIRNEMADLEEMGFLMQPHASAGRIPSDKAYRLYVDRYMKSMNIDSYIKEDVRELYNQYFGEFNELIKKTAEVLTRLTNLTAIVTLPDISELNIKEMRLMHIDGERVLLVIITREGIVKNAEVRLSQVPVKEQLDHLTEFLNLCARDIQNDNRGAEFTKALDALTDEEQRMLKDIFTTVRHLMNEDTGSRFYADGVTEIFRYPEFRNDTDKAAKLLDVLHRRDLTAQLIDEMATDGVRIQIGEENDIDGLSDCSIISATYRLNGRPIGSIGIVGPTRIDYDYCVSVINALTEELTNHLDESIGGSLDNGKGE